MRLAEKVALVTGAAHRVGRAIALALARRGCGIVLHYGRSAAAAESTAAEIRALGCPVWLESADLRSPAEIERLAQAVGERAGRLDVLVNSAASFERKPLLEIEAAEWDEVLVVNLRAPFLLIKACAPLLRTSPRAAGEAGLIVNVVDLSGLQPWRGYAHHGASKAGLTHLTRVAARELGPEIRVNAVAPGAVLPPPGMDESDPAWARTGERLPVGHTGDPEQIGETVVFFAENEFTTGALLLVEGGEALLGAGHR